MVQQLEIENCLVIRDAEDAKRENNLFDDMAAQMEAIAAGNCNIKQHFFFNITIFYQSSLPLTTPKNKIEKKEKLKISLYYVSILKKLIKLTKLVKVTYFLY
jgi:hypothetical protein